MSDGSGYPTRSVKEAVEKTAGREGEEEDDDADAVVAQQPVMDDAAAAAKEKNKKKNDKNDKNEKKIKYRKKSFSQASKKKGKQKKHPQKKSGEVSAPAVWLQLTRDSTVDYPLGFLIDQGQRMRYPDLAAVVAWLCSNLLIAVAVGMIGMKVAHAADTLAAYLSIGCAALCVVASFGDFGLVYFGKTHRASQILAAPSGPQASVPLVHGFGLPIVLHWIICAISRVAPFLGLMCVGYVVDRLPDGVVRKSGELSWRNPITSPPVCSMAAAAPLVFWGLYLGQLVLSGEDTVDLTVWVNPVAMLVAFSCIVYAYKLLKVPEIEFRWVKQ